MTAAPSSLPSGRVTFVFTDVVGSTRTFIEHGEAYADALTRLHERTAFHAASGGGSVVETEGDGAFLAFPDARGAIDSVSALQQELESESHPGLRLRIRAGAHTGDAIPIAGHYLALAVYVAARVSAAANAGQLLATDAVLDELDGPQLGVKVGSYRLKDIAEPVRLWRLTGDDTPPRATPARRTNVQEPRTSFVGRGEELARLSELIAVPGLVTVCGPGGVGKTRLVSELALQHAEHIPGGAWLVELATLDTPDLVVGAVATALGLNSLRIEDVADELTRRGPCLLVLDNCEHLIDAAAEVAERVAASCRDVTVLATSREPLALSGERVWTLQPFGSGSEGVQLFRDRAPVAGVPELDPVLVGKLCAGLDGLPLAIELAAGHVGTASMNDLLAVVTSGGEAFERRGGPERQRSLDGVLEWSLSRLPAPLRDSLLVLAVFPGRFSAAMARSVLAKVTRCDADALRALTARSLVDLDGEDYRLLVTIRDAARRRLGDDAALRDGALDAIALWTAELGAERYGARGSPRDMPEDELLAIEAGVERGLSCKLSGMGKAWHLLASGVDARGASRHLLELADRALQLIPLDPDSVLVVQAASNIVRIAGSGRTGLSDTQLDAMLRVARAGDDAVLLERVLHTRAGHAENKGDYDSAHAMWLEVQALCETRPEVASKLPPTLVNLGVLHWMRDDLERASEVTRRAAELARQDGSALLESIAECNLSEYALLDDQPRAARDHAVQSLRAAPAGSRIRAGTFSMLARAHAALGDRDAALEAGRQAHAMLVPTAEHNETHREYLDALLDDIPDLRSG